MLRDFDNPKIFRVEKAVTRKERLPGKPTERESKQWKETHEDLVKESEGKPKAKGEFFFSKNTSLPVDILESPEHAKLLEKALGGSFVHGAKGKFFRKSHFSPPLSKSNGNFLAVAKNLIPEMPPLTSAKPVQVPKSNFFRKFSLKNAIFAQKCNFLLKNAIFFYRKKKFFSPSEEASYPGQAPSHSESNARGDPFAGYVGRSRDSE